MGGECDNLPPSPVRVGCASEFTGWNGNMVWQSGAQACTWNHRGDDDQRENRQGVV